MKLLLAIVMSTVVTGTAFGACSDAKSCTSEVDCKALSKDSGPKFDFVESRAQKCMVVDTSVATNCLENNNSSGGKVVAPGAAGAGGTTATKTETK